MSDVLVAGGSARAGARSSFAAAAASRCWRSYSPTLCAWPHPTRSTTKCFLVPLVALGTGNAAPDRNRLLLALLFINTGLVGRTNRVLAQVPKRVLWCICCRTRPRWRPRAGDLGHCLGRLRRSRRSIGAYRGRYQNKTKHGVLIAIGARFRSGWSMCPVGAASLRSSPATGPRLTKCSRWVVPAPRRGTCLLDTIVR